MQIEFFTIAVLTLLMSLGSSTLAHGEGLTAHDARDVVCFGCVCHP